MAHVLSQYDCGSVSSGGRAGGRTAWVSWAVESQCDSSSHLRCGFIYNHPRVGMKPTVTVVEHTDRIAHWQRMFCRVDHLTGRIHCVSRSRVEQ